jgi:hypothetical protein
MDSGQRKYSRCGFSQIITYSLLPQIDDKVSTGMLHDFSYSGLCIVIRNPIQEGQEIFVKSSLMSNSITAVVRWCCDTGNSTYKVGLEFKSKNNVYP